MATQYGKECWCAEEVDVEKDFGRHGDGAVCDYPCTGDEVLLMDTGILEAHRCGRLPPPLL